MNRADRRRAQRLRSKNHIPILRSTHKWVALAFIVGLVFGYLSLALAILPGVVAL